jgi:hypothetical protein
MTISTLEVPPSNIALRLATGDLFAGTMDQFWSLLGNVDSSILATSPRINVDGTTLRFGIGPEAPDQGLLHIKTADSGADVQAIADSFVIEGTGNIGTTILTDDTGMISLVFGSPAEDEGAILQYNANAVLGQQSVDHIVSGVNVFSCTENIIVINQDANDVDFRVEGTTNTNLIRTDAGDDTVGIGVAPVNGSILTLNTTTSPLEFIVSTFNNLLIVPPAVTTGYLTVEIGGSQCFIPCYTAIPTV